MRVADVSPPRSRAPYLQLSFPENPDGFDAVALRGVLARCVKNRERGVMVSQFQGVEK